MFRLYNAARSILHLGPREYLRQRMKLPLAKLVYETVDLYKVRTKTGVTSIRDLLLRGTVVALITASLVWLSIIMYVAFYYAYVPTISHERPVHLKFKSCGEDGLDKQRNLCSYPSAHVELSRRQQLLMQGQPYKIHLDLEMPESPKNKQLGMFMVCADFHGIDGTLVANSCRSTMLHYKSTILDYVYKFVFIPMFIVGVVEEKQNVHIELFSDFQENDSEPVTNIFVEIQTMNIEIYSAKFLIHAHFTGLRHVMYHWPILSAAVGITSNLFFIAFICMISWYQVVHSEEYLQYVQSQLNQKDFNDELFNSSDEGEEGSYSEGNKSSKNGEEKDFIEDVK